MFVKDIMRVTLNGEEYVDNAALFILLKEVTPSRRDVAFLKSIARGEDSAR